MSKEQLILIIAQHVLFLDERGGGPEGIYYTKSDISPQQLPDKEYLFSELESLITRWNSSEFGDKYKTHNNLICLQADNHKP